MMSWFDPVFLHPVKYLKSAIQSISSSDNWIEVLIDYRCKGRWVDCQADMTKPIKGSLVISSLIFRSWGRPCDILLVSCPLGSAGVVVLMSTTESPVFLSLFHIYRYQSWDASAHSSDFFSNPTKEMPDEFPCVITNRDNAKFITKFSWFLPRREEKQRLDHRGATMMHLRNVVD